MIRRTLRAIHYSKSNWDKSNPLKSHSDMRDLRGRYEQLTKTNTDFRELKADILEHTRYAVWTWGALILGVGYTVHSARSMRKEFEMKFLSQLPQKEYEEQDYHYKFWEFALPKPHAKYGDMISSENSKGKYVVMYHGSVENGNHLAMQRFARLKKYMMLRKVVDVECVFVAMDHQLDPKLLLEYASNYGDDIIPSWAGDEDAQSQLPSTFLNLGCLYLFDRSTGQVLYITDPAKFPLEALSSKLLFVIGRSEDLQKSKDWAERGQDFRIGHGEDLMVRVALY